MLLRAALTMPRQPAVHFVFLGAGGASSTYERVSKLRQALAPGGALAAYSKFAVDAFDAFGKPFSKLRAAAPKRRVDKKGEKPCEGPNIADCPLAPRRQDGHHARAAHPGYDEREHAAWRAHDNNNLFVNWHPGALGHEVIGSQLAFAHLRLMLRALDMLARAAAAATSRASSGSRRRALAAAEAMRARAVRLRRLPAGLRVFDAPEGARPRRRRLGRQRHRARARPRRGSTLRARRTGARPRRSTSCARARGATPRSATAARSRALRATASERSAARARRSLCCCACRSRGARERRAACCSPRGSYQWSKPLQYANWRRELEVELDGRRCTPPACQVLQAAGGYRQDLLIDVALARGARDGAACAAKGPAEIVLRVKPVAVGDEICAKMPRHGRCEAAGAWRRYDAQCIKKPDESCALKIPRSARPEDVAAFISQ